MFDKSRRKELTRGYAMRKQPNGVYAVRCGASGEVWVAWTRNLDKRWNALLFQAKSGGAYDREFQAAVTKHGPDTFSYEVLERVEEENEHTLKTLLPERAEHWRQKLNAGTMRGF
jgi:hypothetical protein